MEVAIDAAGRLVIPKELRDRLGLSGGGTVRVCERDGRIEIEPVPSAMRLRRRSGVSVAVADEELPALTDQIVRETLERVRR